MWISPIPTISPRLLELCEEQTSWPKAIQEAEELTPYAITTRYPGEDEEVTKAEAEQAIHIAIRVQHIARTILIQAGIELSKDVEYND